MTEAQSTLELAMIGNGQVAGLLDAAGRLVWACMPRPDSDPTMCALLTRAGGRAPQGVFAIELCDQRHHSQRYLRNTAIVETRLADAAGGELRVLDICPRFLRLGRMFRPMMFVRIVELLSGKPQMRMRCAPTVDYGARRAERIVGSHHLSFALADQPCRLTTDASLSAMLEEREVLLERPLAFLIGPDEPSDQPPQSLARSLLEQTENYWHEWVRSLAVPVDWQEAVIRAAITLKLCTFGDSGAVLSALTTSIPEAADSDRNWDYRYCWLRDSFFVVQALNRLGATRTMEGFLRYISNVVAQSSGGALQPMYGITGATQLEESIVTTLAGYRGIGPVRAGNRAFEQRQHDVYGAVILAASQYFYDARLTAPGDVELFERLEALGHHAVAMFEQPDAGPWEFRGREQIHTFPAVMCWAACDRLARIAQHLRLDERALGWRKLADCMRPRILQRGLLPEDIDPLTGEHWGNYPQTYSMVGVILSALRLSRSWDQVL